jgi:hypothetical protein
MPERTIHPDDYYGAEAAGEKAGEEVWFKSIRRLKEEGNVELAKQVSAVEFFRRDPDGNVFVELNGQKFMCGHISEGYEILTRLINKPQETLQNDNPENPPSIS